MFKMKKNLSPIFITIFLFFAVLAFPALAYEIVANNPLGTEDITEFFQGIMSHMQGLIGYLALVFILIGGVLYITASGDPKRITLAKTCWVGALIGLALAVMAPTFLKEIKAIALKDGIMPTNINEALTVKEIAINTVNFLLSILGILAIIGLVVSAVIYVVSFGNSSVKETAQKGVASSLIGIIIAGSAIILIRQIANLIAG